VSENPVDAQKRKVKTVKSSKMLFLKVRSTVVVTEHGCHERKKRDSGDDEDGLESTPELILAPSPQISLVAGLVAVCKRTKMYIWQLMGGEKTSWRKQKISRTTSGRSGVDFRGHSGTMIISELSCLMFCRQSQNDVGQSVCTPMQNTACTQNSS
jgi:hypothetical protein